MNHLLTLTLLCCYAIAAHTADVSINVKDTRQRIEGFGTCIVSWGKVARSDFYNDEMARVFCEDMGFNILRVNVAPWGYPQTENADDISADKIDLQHKNNSRVKVFIDFAKKLKAINPDLRIIGTVWSPPGWMKVNGEITGGKKNQEPSIQGSTYKKKDRESRNRMKPKYYQHFCNLVAAMCQLHKEHDVPFYAMSAGNEVMFSQEFESCTWIAKDFATINGMLGKTLEEKGFKDIILFGPETMTKHNWSIANPLYIKELQANKDAWKYVTRFATHGYVDGFASDMTADSSIEYWKLIKDHGKPYWMTEGGTGGHDWPEPLSGVAAGVHNSLVNGNASAFVPWQIASANGARNEHALIPGTTMSKKSYAMRHFSRFIPTDSVRIHIPERITDVQMSAFHHQASNTVSIIIINHSKGTIPLTGSLDGLSVEKLQLYRTSEHDDLKQLPELSIKKHQFKLDLQGQSIYTLSSIDLSTKN